MMSIVVPAYNRAQPVQALIWSCLDQDFEDFEVVIVDDGSTDGTAAEIRERFDDARLRVIEHDVNRGISAARGTGAKAARGEWLVFLDSDGVLLPGALAGLREVIATAPSAVGSIRAQLVSDDEVEPSPAAVSTLGRLDYHALIRFMSETDRVDLVSCVRREEIEAHPFMVDRRGPMELLEILNRARSYENLIVPLVVFRHRTDSHNSTLRSTDFKTVPPRMLAEAPDMAWMAETVERDHGAALRQYGPSLWRTVLKISMTQRFLMGERRKGLRYAVRALRAGSRDPQILLVVALGVLGPKTIAYGALVQRSLMARLSHPLATPGSIEVRVTS